MDVKPHPVAPSRLALAWERVSIPYLVTGLALGASLLTTLLIALSWQNQVDEVDQGRVDRYGAALTAQLAAVSLEPLISGDRIRLGVLAQRMVEFPEIATVSVHTIDDRTIATAGEAQNRFLRQYVHPIELGETVAGHVRLTVDPEAFRVPVTSRLWLPALIMLLTSGGLGYALGQHIQARTLPRPRPPAPVLRTGPLHDGNAAEQYLLVVNFFNQSSVPPEPRSEVLARVQARVHQVALLYGGESVELPGTGLLVRFAQAEDAEPSFRFLCAALLCADMLEELNDGEYRNLSPRLIFRFGLHVTLTGSMPVESAQWRETEFAADTLLLSAVARNGTVALSGEAFAQLDASDRCDWQPCRNPILDTMTTGNGARCVIVNDLVDDYRTLLDNELELLLAQPPSTASASTR
jgi:hypothetical protein